MIKALATLALTLYLFQSPAHAQQQPTDEQTERFEIAATLLLTGELEEALIQLEALGDEGHTEALFLLGLNYAPVLDVPLEDLKKGIGYMTRASELGHHGATKMMAIAYLEDEIRDEEKSRMFFLRAADAHQDPEAYFMLGRMSSAGIGTEQNFEEAAEWYKKAAEQGSPNAMNALGVYHREGIGGLKKDPTTSFAYFKEAASVNLPDANFQLGDAYRLGIGTDIDYRKATQHYRKAAEKNHTEAAWFLALALATGNGVKKNLLEAHVWCGFAKNSDIPEVKTKATSCVEELDRRLTEKDMERSAEMSKRISRSFQANQAPDAQGFILTP